MRQLNQITLQTPESVKLQFTLAGVGNRILALVIDYLVIGLLLVVVLWIFNILLLTSVDLSAGLGLDQDAVGLWILAFQILLTSFLYTVYFIGFEVLWQGQSPGKRYAQIRVVREDGRMVGLRQAVLRTLIRPIDDLFFVGACLILLTEREKRLGDWAAGTLVIQVESPATEASLSISEAARTLTPLLPEQALGLSPDDFAVIREFLRRRSLMAPAAKDRLARDLCRQLTERMPLPDFPIGTTPEILLEAIYLAYQQQLSLPSR